MILVLPSQSAKSGVFCTASRAWSIACFGPALMFVRNFTFELSKGWEARTGTPMTKPTSRATKPRFEKKDISGLLSMAGELPD